LLRRFRTGKDGTVTLMLEPRLRVLAKLGGHYKLRDGACRQQITLVALARALRDKNESLRMKDEEEFQDDAV
jgi:hypothetical protein